MSEHLIYVDTKNKKKEEICNDIQQRQIKKQLVFFLSFFLKYINR